jgi:hypothetical protein
LAARTCLTVSRICALALSGRVSMVAALRAYALRRTASVPASNAHLTVSRPIPLLAPMIKTVAMIRWIAGSRRTAIWVDLRPRQIEHPRDLVGAALSGFDC